MVSDSILMQIAYHLRMVVKAVASRSLLAAESREQETGPIFSYTIRRSMVLLHVRVFVSRFLIFASIPILRRGGAKRRGGCSSSHVAQLSCFSHM